MPTGDAIYQLDLRCPHCGFEGGFPQKRVKLFGAGRLVAALLGVIRVDHDQDRTFVCPQCGVEIHFPEGIRIYDKLHQ